MKKVILAAVACISAALISSCSPQTDLLKINGSDTVLPLTQKEAESFMDQGSTTKVTVTGGGSGVGISALMNGATDIAQASRRIKFDESQKIEAGGKELKEVIIAYDALAIVVNHENTVSQLSREQLEDIFTGDITNWKEVGGDDLEIVPYSRETSSGTYEFFKESVLDKKNYFSGIMSLPATGAIIQSIGQTKGAIGYVGLAYLNKDVKALEVSYDSGVSFVYPSIENAKNETYPVVRPLYYYYFSESESKVKSFLDYVLSAEGQKIVADIGYIPVR